MAVFTCKICGGSLEITPNQSIAVCEYCGTKQTLPKLGDDRKATLYDRAGHFRRNNDYDKAMGIYEQILNEDPSDAESYWSLVLCRYGIEYVEDPDTRSRVITVNRAQFTSIFDDEDYKSALQYADAAQRELYESEAETINGIQKGILAISQQEEPFDVFICYKETDTNGRRTQDSVLATELYHELTREGFRVFFSRITLEDKLGIAYEPYIFAALNSAKVMVALGTRAEHFNAVWVRNEWSRYLALIKNGAKKTLIPAYRGMDPYDLPDEFSHLQAQDMSKLGFMQDLVHGIRKYVTSKEQPSQKNSPAPPSQPLVATSPLIKRMFLFLEDGEFNRADAFCEQILNQDPENAQAYLGKLMIELSIKKQEDLSRCETPFDNSKNYQKIIRFADESLISALKGYIATIQARIAKEEEEKEQRAREAEIYAIYDSALGHLHNGALEDDAFTYINLEYYIQEMEFAVKYFSQISEWKDSKEKIAFCQEKIEKYRMAMAKQEELHQIQIAKTKKFAKKTALIASPILLTMVIMIVIYFAVIVPSNRFTIQCDLAGGTASQATTFEYYTWDKEISLFTPTRTGYTFVGWTGTDLSDPNSELILPQGSKGNRSYIANWKANTYTVTLDANGGTCDVTTITVTYDQPYTLPDATFADHDFTGWLYINNRTQYVSSGTWKTPSDITIQANWLPVGLEYSSYETTVFISKYTGTATELIIPSVIKGKNVTQINSMAFSFCASLTRITIPDSVTNIESSAFYNCDSLTSVTIPHSVTSIKGEAFAYCDNLISITFQGTKQEWKKITKGVAWGYGTPLAVIHCTDGDIISD